MKEKKILVTGATGFVGRSLCSFLNSLDYIVYPTARIVASNQSDFKYFITGDLNGDTDWSKALLDVGVVIHLAARAHILNDRAENPLAEYRLSNTVPSIKLATDAIKAGVQRFIFVSSVGVNGAETFGHPYRQSDLAKPHSPYAISKYEAELELRALFQGTDTDLVILRPPMIYGPGAPGNFALIMKFVKMRIPIPLGGISNKRSFIALENFVGLIEACIAHPRVANKTLLVNDGFDLSTSEFVQMIGILANKKPLLIRFSPSVLRLLLDLVGKNKAAQSLLGDLQICSREAFELLDWTPVFNPLTELSKISQTRP